jgi:hypothetical protein
MTSFSRTRLEPGGLENIAEVIESEIFVGFSAENFRSEFLGSAIGARILTVWRR